MRIAIVRCIRNVVLAGAGFAALAGLAGPASAQWYGRPFVFQNPPVIVEEDNLSPREIAGIVRRMGYSDVGRPRFAGDEYLVDATTRAGTRVRLVLDAFTGHLIDSYLSPEPSPRRIARAEEPRRPAAPAERPAARPLGEGESPQVAPVRPAPAGRPPEAAAPPRATPSAPTVVRREPLLPPQAPREVTPPATATPPAQRREVPRAQPQRAAPQQPSARAPAAPPAGVGSGTRQQPRIIPGAPPPPAALDDVERARRDEAPLNSVPPVGLD